jgi:hypothetical protein
MAWLPARKNQDKLWAVVYSDGDREEMDEAELTRCLAQLARAYPNMCEV